MTKDELAQEYASRYWNGATQQNVNWEDLTRTEQKYWINHAQEIINLIQVESLKARLDEINKFDVDSWGDDVQDRINELTAELESLTNKEK